MRTQRTVVTMLWAVLFLSTPGCSGVEEPEPGSTQKELLSRGEVCTFTQGYWKNHPDAWPVTSLTLGGVAYSQAQLLAIFHQPVKGNGLVSLAHQLISARLNVALGATSPTITETIALSNEVIAILVIPPLGTGYLEPSATSALVTALDQFNNGFGSVTCNPPPPRPICGNAVLESGEECDDGNTVSGDGCSSICVCERPPPVCGNGVLDGEEQCDDGNTRSGDGCSSRCVCEAPPG